VAGEDLEAVGEGRERAVKALVEEMSEAVGFAFTEKVRAAKRTYEEEVAGEEGERLGGAAGEVEEEEGEVLRSVAGGVESLDSGFAYCDCVAIVEFAVGHGGLIELVGVVSAEGELGSSGGCESGRTGGEVGVDVGLEDVADREGIVGSILEVAVDVADGIDDDSFAI
jgi:hypothetical protein